LIDDLIKPKSPVFLVVPGSQSLDSNHLEAFSKFHRDYLDQMSMFVDCYSSFFLTQKEKAGNTSGIEALKQNCFAKNMSDQERKIAREDLDRFLNEKLEQYYQFLHNSLEAPEDAIILPQQYIMALDKLRKDITTAEPLHRLTQINTRIGKLTVSVLDRIINGIFGQVHIHFLVKLNEFSSETMFNLCRQMTNWLKESLISNALISLEDFVNTESAQSFGTSELLIRIKDAMLQFWHEMANRMMVFSS
jgi:hypothetical protein